LDVRTSTNAPARGARRGDQRLQRVAAEQRVGGEGVGLQAGDGPNGDGVLADQRLRVGGGGDRDVAALAVGEHEQAALARVRADVLEREPAGAPRRSKHASCGLTATQAGPAASISAQAVREHRRGVSSRETTPRLGGGDSRTRRPRPRPPTA
jgi:hypothetical protein